MSSYNDYNIKSAKAKSKRLILLLTFALSAIFTLGLGVVFAYFTSTAHVSGSQQFVTLTLDIQNSSGTSVVSNSYAWKSGKLDPGDTLSISNYRVSNSGEASCYSLINFEVEITPTSNQTPTIKYSTWYNLNGDLVHTANLSRNATPSTLIAPGAYETLNFEYVLSGKDITNDYQNASASLKLTAYAIQNINIPNVSNALQAATYIVNNSGVGATPATYNLTIDMGDSRSTYTLVGGSTIFNSMKALGIDATYSNTETIGLFTDEKLMHVATEKDCLWGNKTLYSRVATQDLIDNESVTITNNLASISASSELVSYLDDEDAEPVDLVIPSSIVVNGVPYQVTEIKARAFENRAISSVTIPSGITRIGKNAFSGCKDLTSVTIPNTVTEIGDSAFMDAGLEDIDFTDAEALEELMNNSLRGTKITEVTIPASVTRIGDSAFLGCSELTTFEFEQNSQCLTVDNHAFSGCSKLTEITFPSNVTTLGGENLFYNCKNIETITFENPNIEVTFSCGMMFAHCKKLTSVNTSGFDTSGIKNSYGTMNYMFWDCPLLTDVDVSNFDTSNVTSMMYMFYECINLTTLDVSNFNTSNVTNMNSMFADCKKLEYVDVSGFDTAKVTNMGGMFANCQTLKRLDVSNFSTSNVTNMYAMFMSCGKLTEIDVSGFDTKNVTNMARMFQSCYNVLILDVSNFNTAKVTTMEFMFYYCLSVTELDTSKFDVSLVTTMNSMFSTCQRLTSLKVFSITTSVVTNMHDMFYDCRKVKVLDLSNFNTSTVTDMIQMFFACTELTTIYASSNFNTSNVSSSNNMFNSCSKLVGGNGTAYNSSYIDKTYARLDTETQVGYFSVKI